MKLNELIEFKKDLYFEGAVQIDWFYNTEKAQKVAENFVFHGCCLRAATEIHKLETFVNSAAAFNCYITGTCNVTDCIKCCAIVNCNGTTLIHVYSALSTGRGSGRFACLS